MRRVDIERKRTTLLPWAAGLVVLAFIVWGVTTLLAAPGEEDQQIAMATTADTLTPAPIPAPPQPVRAAGARSVEALAPLDDEHVGEVVRSEGEVVATGTTGFWMVAGSELLRVDSERIVRKGQSVAVEATIAPAGDERTDQIVSEVLGRTPQVEGWRVVRSVKLVERNGTERTDR